MCGIAGVWCLKRPVSERTAKEVIIPLLRQTHIRGDDSCGIYSQYSDGSELEYKHISGGMGSVGVGHLMDACVGARAIVSNSRAYPTQEYIGNITESDQQPFESKRWVVTHNGIISNDVHIASKWDIERFSTVDASVIPDLLQHTVFGTGGRCMANLLDMFRRDVEGSFAMVLFDKVESQMYAVTNFMPLYYSYDSYESIWYIYSEPEMFRQVSHCQINLNDKWKHGKFPPYTISTIDGGTLKTFSFRREINNPKKVLISFSGGNDSMVNARLYQSQGYDVNLIHFKYGQRAEEREEFATRKIAQNWKMGLHVVDVRSLFGQISKGSVLLNPTFTLPEGKRTLDMESTLSYVANRNAIFGNIAAGLAEQIGAGIVVVNANLGDSVYPDNNYPFLRTMEELFNYSLNWHSKVRFTSPLMNLEKHEIIKLGLYLSGDFFDTVSCYYPEWDEHAGGVVNCGNCGCCLYRERAFKMTGVKDPQPYRKSTVDWEKCAHLSSQYWEYAHQPFDSRMECEPDQKMKSILERAVLFL